MASNINQAQDSDFRTNNEAPSTVITSDIQQLINERYDGASEVIMQSLVDGKPKPPAQGVKERLLSLDMFRGLTMMGMILVDCQGSCGEDGQTIWPIKHSRWFGWTTADQVFPNFLFITGMAIPFALKREDRHDKKVWLRIIRRGVILFLLGLFINILQYLPYPDTDTNFTGKNTFAVRIPGILQRSAICYIVVSAHFLLLEKIWYHLAIHTVLVCVYLGFQYGFSVPTVPKDSIEPCGKAALSPECNFGGYLDRLVFGSTPFALGGDGEISQWAWLPTDPEGIWGHLTSLFNPFVGMCYSLILQHFKAEAQQKGVPVHKTRLLQYWLTISLTLCFIGMFFNLQGMELNKRMWTVPFMFFTSGFSGLSLTGCFYLFDVIKNYRVNDFAQPLVWLGMNPLFVYVVMMTMEAIIQSNFQAVTGPDNDKNPWRQMCETVFQSWLVDPYVANMAMALFWLGLLTVMAWAMWHKKIFVKL